MMVYTEQSTSQYLHPVCDEQIETSSESPVPKSSVAQQEPSTGLSCVDHSEAKVLCDTRAEGSCIHRTTVSSCSAGMWGYVFVSLTGVTDQ